MVNHISNGDFKGFKVKKTITGKLMLSTIYEDIDINSNTVESVTPLGANSLEIKGKSSGGLGRAIVGGAIAGPVGALVGVGTSKTKSSTVVSSYDVCVVFKNGKKFTCEVDKDIYMALMNI